MRMSVVAAAPPVSRLALPDGRTLAFRGYGHEGGAPVLFVPGAASGSLMRFGEELLDGRGLQLHSVDRPGLGGSDADLDKSLASVGDDLRRLTATLGGPVPVVANSQGAPFALAAALAGAASRLVLVSPVDEVAHPPTTALLPEPVRELVAAVAANPDEAVARFADFSAESLFDFVLGDHPPSDAAVFGDPDFRALLRAALDDGFRWGPDGYARDTVLAMSPFSSAPTTRVTRPTSGRFSPHGSPRLSASWCQESADPFCGHIPSRCSMPHSAGSPCPWRDHVARHRTVVGWLVGLGEGGRGARGEPGGALPDGGVPLVGYHREPALPTGVEGGGGHLVRILADR
jgi:hypothetical protein